MNKVYIVDKMVSRLSDGIRPPPACIIPVCRVRMQSASHYHMYTRTTVNQWNEKAVQRLYSDGE
jgi:hypothetical protein